ncbi:phosphotransferase [Methylohalobius crimeensis]|uniref:phosphotransferase n=1 Tax=Methylohalobius crimeensis TaxID=244365 RepID=UPI0003B42A4F|nr:hypothetical protein [Methylohalobius crimeensis]
MDAALKVKLAFLSRPESYPDHPGRVEVIQTHMAWVFLTDRYVYKLKKPVRYPYLDFSTLEAREFYCRQELHLNRRLAPDVYLDILPLTKGVNGRPILGGHGEILDFLVWMRRLPRERMLDTLLKNGCLERRHLQALAECLTDFYRVRPAQLDGEAYRRRYCEAILLNCRELETLRHALPGMNENAMCEAQLVFLERWANWFDDRVAGGRIVEGHGDLKPAHVCFESAWPKIIDCLEFSRELRLLDCADETAYLAMECDYMGYGQVGDWFLEDFGRYCKDDVPPAVRGFYMAYRATLRARLLLARTREAPPSKWSRWQRRAGRYLQLAAGYCPRR